MSKQKNLALIQSEERYRRLFESAQDGILILDGESEIVLDANPYIIGMLGYSLGEIVGKRLWELGFLPDRHKAELAFEELREKRYIRYENLPLQTKDGRKLPVEFVSNIYLVDGKQVIQCNIRDLSENVRLEQKLADESKLLHTVIDNLTDLVYLKDLDSRFVIANQTLAELMGCSRTSDLIGKSDADFYPAELAARLKREELEIISTGRGRYNFEERVATISGTPLWLLSTKVPVLDDKGVISGIVGFGHDISAHKELEKELLEKSAALDQLPDYILVTDAAGAIGYVNPAFQTITGYTLAEVAGKTPRVLKSGNQDAAFYRGLWNTLSAGKVWSGRIVNRRKDGSLFHEQKTIAPIADKRGTISGFVAIGKDVTQDMKLEESIRQSQKVETIGQLAGGVAHDFNNMLQVIHGYLEVLLSKDAVPGDQARTYLEEIKKAADRAARLTQQLLAFSRRQMLDLKVHNLNDVIATTLKLVRRVIGEDIQLEFIPGPALPPVKIDAGQIEQVLLNLCMNSRDAMSTGGTLLIETEAVDLETEYSSDHPWADSGQYVCLTVSDTGIGMTAEVREKIFEPFFTTKDPSQGTGLGLAVVYGIIKQHQGLINVYSEPGKGSSIKIYFQVSDDQPEAGSEQPGPQAALGGTETLLLAEDEESIRLLATLALEEAGYRVMSAADGEEALAVFAAHKEEIPLVILDAMMPIMDGLEAFQKMKVLRPDLRALFCSGYSTTILKDRGVLEEGMEILQKPYDLKDLLLYTRRLIDAGGKAPGRTPA